MGVKLEGVVTDTSCESWQAETSSCMLEPLSCVLQHLSPLSCTVHMPIYGGLVSFLCRCSPKLKVGLVYWATFVFTWCGLWFVKKCCNYILNTKPQFLMPRYIWTMTQPCLQNLEMAASQLGQLTTGCKTSFHYLQFSSKYNHLCHPNLSKSSAIWLVISNPRSAPPHVTRNIAQNTKPSSHARILEGLGTRLKDRWTTCILTD